MFRKIVAISMCILFIFVLASCQKYDVISEESSNYPPINPLPEDKLEIILYYPNDEMEFLLPEIRVVSKTNKKIEELVVSELLKGTTKKSLKTIISSNVKLLSIEIIDGTAYVSFSSNILDREYSEREEAFVVYSIVNTLTSIQGVEKVQILIDGKSKDVLYKHYSIREPLKFSYLIVNNNYLSPLLTINEYHDGIASKNFKQCADLILLQNDSKINYSTILSYMKTYYDKAEKIDINNYIISEYDNDLEIDTDTTIYSSNDTKKEMNIEYHLTYAGGLFKIRDVIY